MGPDGPSSVTESLFVRSYFSAARVDSSASWRVSPFGLLDRSHEVLNRQLGVRKTAPVADKNSACKHVLSRIWFAFVGRPSDSLEDERRERPNIELDACGFQGRQVGGAVFYANNGPGISARGEHRVHQETGYAAFAVRIGMDVAKQPMPQDHADGRLWFPFEQVE